jgi:hypothetical protein
MRGNGMSRDCAAFDLVPGRIHDDKDVQERIVRRKQARRGAADFQLAHIHPRVLGKRDHVAPIGDPLIGLPA